MLKFGDTYLNFGGTYLSGWLDPYNPLKLPSNTVRVRTNDGKVPYKMDSDTRYETATLELYKQASSHTTPPSEHREVFYNCGSNTQTGAAELAQIPDDWK